MPACRRRAGDGRGADPPARRRALGLWHRPRRRSRRSARRAGCEPLGEDVSDALGELEAQARAAMAAQGVSERPAIERRARLRSRAATRRSNWRSEPRGDCAHAFDAAHRARFGYRDDERAGDRRHARRRGDRRRPALARTRAASGPADDRSRPCLTRRHGAGRSSRPGADRRSVVDDRRRARLERRASTRDGNLILTRAAPRDARHARSAPTADPVRLEIFNNLFMAIAEEMGAALQATATSVNIKERLDFSCALFDARGRADRQRAAHPGPSRLDGRKHPHDHRQAGATRRRTRHPARRRLCRSTTPIAAAPICPTSP